MLKIDKHLIQNPSMPRNNYRRSQEANVSYFLVRVLIRHLSLLKNSELCEGDVFLGLLAEQNADL